MILCVGVLLISFPDLLPTEPAQTERTPFAQLVALRGPQALGLAVVGGVLGVLALLRARHRKGARTALVAAVVLAVAAVQAGGLVERGLGAGTQSVGGGTTDSASWDGTVTVYALNAMYSGADAATVAGQVIDSGADVVVLPEADAAYGAEVGGLLAEEGLRYTVYTATAGEDSVVSAVPEAATTPHATQTDAGHEEPDTSVNDTTVLVSTALGEYKAQSQPGLGFGAVLLKPVGEATWGAGTRPTILGVHTVPPVGERMGRWRSSVSGAVAFCAPEALEPGLIIAGDFNATIDHAPMRDLGGCAEAGEQAGIGGLSTWPTSSRTPLLGATIDHVLVDEATWRGRAGEVTEVPGTDHRGVVVELVPAR